MSISTIGEVAALQSIPVSGAAPSYQEWAAQMRAAGKYPISFARYSTENPIRSGATVSQVAAEQIASLEAQYTNLLRYNKTVQLSGNRLGSDFFLMLDDLKARIKAAKAANTY